MGSRRLPVRISSPPRQRCFAEWHHARHSGATVFGRSRKLRRFLVEQPDGRPEPLTLADGGSLLYEAAALGSSRRALATGATNMPTPR